MFRKVKRYLRDPYYEIGHDMLAKHPNWMSDKWWLSVVWKETRGYKLDWSNPMTYNEKLQWLKLYDYRPEYDKFVDKYEAKKWLAQTFGGEFIVPTIGLYERTSDIILEHLPDEFVIKCTHDSGSTYICKGKTNFDWSDVRNKLDEHLKFNFYYQQREKAYKDIQHRIIIEPLLLCANGRIPNDYKCFFVNGRIAFIYVSFDREGINDRCVYNKKWERLPFVYVARNEYKPGMNTSIVPRPRTLEKMIEIGSRIAKLFKTVRVDFYDVDGKLYIGEITLYHGGGADCFYPEEYDLIYGQKLKLD